jgi:hypothetical protein
MLLVVSGIFTQDLKEIEEISAVLEPAVWSELRDIVFLAPLCLAYFPRRAKAPFQSDCGLFVQHHRVRSARS